MTKRPTRCQQCRAVKIEQSVGPGHPQIFCGACMKARKAAVMARWYAKNRQGNAAWKKENKERAKLWREQNKDYVREYNAQRSGDEGRAR